VYEVAIHLYRVNVEFPAAVWSVVLSLPNPPEVGESIDVKGTSCIVREVEPRVGVSEDEGETVAANVYADPTGEPDPDPSS
jgi:hypothetical protein